MNDKDILIAKLRRAAALGDRAAWLITKGKIDALARTDRASRHAARVASWKAAA